MGESLNEGGVGIEREQHTLMLPLSRAPLFLTRKISEKKETNKPTCAGSLFVGKNLMGVYARTSTRAISVVRERTGREMPVLGAGGMDLGNTWKKGITMYYRLRRTKSIS